MKTYLFDTLNRFRRFSENLDVKATLCNRPWQVFNDSGEKELYIFQEDGTLLITYSGRVTHSTWQYIAANKSIVISAGEQSYMVHPAFMDNVLFALQVDGTNECAFLIDENNAQSFAPRSYTALMGYFEEKERRALEEERRKRQAAIDVENRRRQAAIEEQHRQEQSQLENRARQVYEGIGLHYFYTFVIGFFPTILAIILLGVILWSLFPFNPFIMFPVLFGGIFCGVICQTICGEWILKKRLRKYTKKNPNALEISYLIELYNNNAKYFKIEMKDLLGR
ncbi:MAG: hypothetical protein IKK87_00015 [Bacteroidaceae bacterium]|nr:hypothetical protein [Bacteroidaceae bacterium]